MDPATVQSPSGTEGRSIRSTLRRIIMITTAAVLALACSVFIAHDFYSDRVTVAREMTALAGVVGSQSTAALAFEDPRSAWEMLAALAAEPQVQAACLYLKDGRRFAAWSRPGSGPVEAPAQPPAEGVTFESGRLAVVMPVVEKGDRVGTILLHSDLQELQRRLQTHILVVIVVLLASALAAWILSSRLQGRITRPLLRLTGALKEVSERKDYSVRAGPLGEGEIAVLARGFDEMLVQIQARDAALQQARDELERRVEERSRELQKKEEQLLQSQKMEAVGRLSGGLAHDFNNLLSAILGFGELALTQPNLDPQTRGFLEESQKAGQQAAALTSQLLAMSRQQFLQPVLLDLNAMLDELRPAVERLLGGEITLDLRTAPDLPSIKADPGPVRQAILHLVTHAREAMPKGGRLTVETALAKLDAPLAWRNETVPPGVYARLSVGDTGEGVSPEAQEHLFEPFFNARGRTLDRATGLGLSTAYGIVKQSGGHIVVHSEPGRGATFSVYLPVKGDAALRKTARNPLPPKEGTTVFLVEDEAMVRKLAGEVLRRSGFAVEEAVNGREALDRFAEDPDRYDLILTDVVMPVMGGRELAERVAELNPAVKIVFMTGYTDDLELQEEVRKRRIPLIAKPFSAAAMVGKVREVLGMAAATAPGGAR